jgi:hypothetical protein
MDKYTRFALEEAEDFPMALALTVFVSLWGRASGAAERRVRQVRGLSSVGQSG